MVEKNPSNIIWGKSATIYSFAVVDEDAPEAFRFNRPYVIALIDLDQGPRITAQLTDIEWEWIEGIKVPEIEIGDPVEMVPRKLKVEGSESRGLIIYGYKFRHPLKSLNPR